jgi:hypothetical protein
VDCTFAHTTHRVPRHVQEEEQRHTSRCMALPNVISNRNRGVLIVYTCLQTLTRTLHMGRMTCADVHYNRSPRKCKLTCIMPWKLRRDTQYCICEVATFPIVFLKGLCRGHEYLRGAYWAHLDIPWLSTLATSSRVCDRAVARLARQAELESTIHVTYPVSCVAAGTHALHTHSQDASTLPLHRYAPAHLSSASNHVKLAASSAKLTTPSPA